MSFLVSLSEKFKAWGRRKDLAVFFELLSPKKNDVILDVGAGTGWIADRVADVCDDVYALEPNESSLNYIRKRHPQVKAFSATANSVPFSEKYFDKLYVVMAFHHFSDQDDALEEFRRIVKAGGLLLINEFYANGPGSFVRYFEKDVLKHNVTFNDPQDLEKRVQAHGFRRESVRNAGSGYFFLARRETEED